MRCSGLLEKVDLNYSKFQVSPGEMGGQDNRCCANSLSQYAQLYSGYIPTHNRVRDEPKLVVSHYMNLIHATPRYHLMPTIQSLNSQVTTSGENWKFAATIYCLFYCFESTAIKLPLAL